ncbi:MAG: amidohydrolase family protein [Candidatus Thiodiazotropha sp. (ex Gloverina cf. vestifex)]|nr:amidohydrolase family protein [Candidatus Thiodiazotropha sp. (ex Gloverina cf. vestifex)]
MFHEVATRLAHFHIIDPRFPLVENQGYLPLPFTCDDYLERMNDLPLKGGVVVSGSFQAFDQNYLLAALETLGPGFVGVSQLPASVDDSMLQQLDDAGVRGVRFNLYRGGSEVLAKLENFAHHIYERLNWHVELYTDALIIDRYHTMLSELPAVSIDHLALSRQASDRLLGLVEQGMKVKASGFGRLESNPIPLLREIFAANPDSLMFGSDLPSTRAPRPFAVRDLERIGEALCENGVKRVFCENARHFYRLPAAG